MTFNKPLQIPSNEACKKCIDLKAEIGILKSQNESLENDLEDQRFTSNEIK